MHASAQWEFYQSKRKSQRYNFVVFFDYKIYESQEAYLDRFWTFSLEEQGLDAYLVKVYPEEHQLHSETLKDYQYWNNLYNSKKAAIPNLDFILF